MREPCAYHLRDLRKKHGSSFLLQIDQLNVLRGETLALLGPTGAGKSSLLRLLAGVEVPTGGQIFLEGQLFPSGSLPLATRRRITLVHQRPLLLTGSVQFNVEYGLRLRGAKSVADKIVPMLDRLKLSGLATASAQTLSGGQVQLVALARALVIEPDVLLLDEPTANLDPAYVALVERTIQDIQRERNTTVVWATHNLFQARRIASHTAFILNGQLVEVACTEQVFERPGDPRTADFVQGRMVF